MLTRVVGLATVGLLVAVATFAVEPVETPASDATPGGTEERSFPESWVEYSSGVEVPANDIDLIDDIPNHFVVLKDQWSAGLPADVASARDSTEYYGLLGPAARHEELGLAECIALALQYNTQLEIQRLGPTQAAAGVRLARSIFDPTAYGEVSKTRLVTPATTVLTSSGAPNPRAPIDTLVNQSFVANAGVRKTLLSGGVIALDWQNERFVGNPSIANPYVPLYTTSLGLSLAQPLLRDFGWAYSLLIVEVAKNTEQASYYNYKAAIADIVTAVESAYWRLVLAIQSVKVQEQSLELANELLRENEGKFNVGTLPRTAVLEAQSRVALRESTLISAVNAREIARDNLRALINYRDPGADSLLIVDPGDRPAVVDYDVDMDRSLRTALEDRPELVAARLGVEGRGLERKIAQNQLLPRLDFVGGVGVNALAGRDGNAASPFAADPNSPATIPVNSSLDDGYGDALKLLPDGRFYSYSAGAQIEIPLSNARAKADYSIANVNFEQARLGLRQLEEIVTLEIKTAVNNLQSGLKSIEATRIARELAEENLRNQQARYDVGLATTKDILDFQDQLTLARFREIEALTTYNTDVAQMRRVEGTLLAARNVLVEKLESEDAPWWARF
jgi:outer membrane protein TolC